MKFELSGTNNIYKKLDYVITQTIIIIDKTD